MKPQGRCECPVGGGSPEPADLSLLSACSLQAGSGGSGGEPPRAARTAWLLLGRGRRGGKTGLGWAASVPIIAPCAVGFSHLALVPYSVDGGNDTQCFPSWAASECPKNRPECPKIVLKNCSSMCWLWDQGSKGWLASVAYPEGQTPTLVGSPTDGLLHSLTRSCVLLPFPCPRGSAQHWPVASQRCPGGGVT